MNTMLIAAAVSVILPMQISQTVAASELPTRSRVRTVARASAENEEARGNQSMQTDLPRPRGIGVENVIAEGWGNSEEESLRDAFRNAIRQVLGAIVDTKTVVEEDRLVLDRIVTFSDGFIDYYKILDRSSDAGYVHRRIMATVKKRDLTMQLRAERAAVSYDGRGLWPEAITKIERRKNASDLFKVAIEDYPWSCLDLSLKGLPKISHTLDTAAYIEPTIVLRLDINKFNDCKRTLCSTLDALCVASGTITSKLAKLNGNQRSAGIADFEKRFFGMESSQPLARQKIEFGQIFEMPGRQSELPKQIAELDNKGGKLLVVGDGRKWTWYLVQERLDISPQSKSAVIRFYGSRKRVIAERQVALGPVKPGLSVNETKVDGKDLSTIFLAPFFLDHAGSGYAVTMLAGCPQLTLRGEIGISVDDLKSIEHVDVKVE